ncbi:hypothetical protein SMUE_15680 [Enterococcus cecorum]
MKLFVGLDVSSDKLDTCFLTDELEILHKGSYHNDIDGATQIKERILSLLRDTPLIKLLSAWNPLPCIAPILLFSFMRTRH